MVRIVLAPTEIMEARSFDPRSNQTLRVWHLQQLLLKHDPHRPVQVFARVDGAPLILDIIKIQDSSGHLQIQVE